MFLCRPHMGFINVRRCTVCNFFGVNLTQLHADVCCVLFKIRLVVQNSTIESKTGEWSRWSLRLVGYAVRLVVALHRELPLCVHISRLMRPTRPSSGARPAPAVRFAAVSAPAARTASISAASVTSSGAVAATVHTRRWHHQKLNQLVLRTTSS